MKKRFGRIALAALLLGLVGCGGGKITSVRAPKEVVTTYTDKATGEEQKGVQSYTYSAPVRMDDGLIRLDGQWSGAGGGGDIILFYLPSGKPIAKREYPEGEQQSHNDYVYLADLTVEDNIRQLGEPESRQGNTFYYSDGGYTEMTTEGDAVTGYDGYAADGTLVIHGKFEPNGLIEDYFLDMGTQIMRIECTNADIPL